MRIAFYAPLKAPTHAVPSGDRLMARQLLKALDLAGFSPSVASEFRSYDGAGNPNHQERLRRGAEQEVRRLIGEYQRKPAGAPKAWFTYHLYYKAPDWIGPPICEALGIPYIVAEPSFAPKRANGPWRLGHTNVGAALNRADVVLCLTRYDMEFVAPEVGCPDQRLLFLPPFVDPARFADDLRPRTDGRATLAASLDLPVDATWMIAVAMMRPGDKLASYHQLADAVGCLDAEDVVLLVAGDGPARGEVETAFRDVLRGRVRFLGELTKTDLAQTLTAADIYVWPAVGEAYGMALLEAQAAGLPVVAGAGAWRGRRGHRRTNRPACRA